MSTGSRLTCLAVVSPESLLRELKRPAEELSCLEEAVENQEASGPRSEPVNSEASGGMSERGRRAETSSKEAVDNGNKVRTKVCRGRKGSRKVKRLDDGGADGEKERTFSFASGSRKGKQKKLSKRRLAYRKSLLIRKKHSGQDK